MVRDGRRAGSCRHGGAEEWAGRWGLRKCDGGDLGEVKLGRQLE